MGLTKRRDSYYVEFRVLDNGKTLTLANGIQGARLKRWKVGCTNKEVAKKLEAKIRTDMMLGLMKSEQDKPVLFSEWAKTYLSLEEVTRLASYTERTRSINAQLVPFFGSKLLGEITAGDVEDFRAHRSSVKSLKTKKTVSVQTVNHDHIALKHCLNIALRRSLILRNPAALVPVPDPENERDRVLSEMEWEKLYNAAQAHLRPILLLAYQLGQRFSEIVNLTWDRVDLKRGFITLRATDTKPRKARQVPLTPDVRATLQGIAKVRGLTTQRVFLFRGKPINRVSRSFKAAVEAAGVTDFRFHDTRHCAATNLRRAGVDTATAMKIVGHESEKMWKRYNAVEEQDLTKAAQNLNTYLTTSVANTQANT
jgi:integrase